MHKLLPLLFLAACSAPQPTTYARGTLVRPPPAPHRPGVGLHTFEPHPEVKPQVQPQPRPKPLPHTPQTRREDTIWASDALRPSTAQWLLGVPPLETERLGSDPGYVAAMQNCANIMRLAITRAGVDDLLEALTGEDRACAAAKLYLACATDGLRRSEQDRAILRDRIDSARGSVATAQGYVDRQCPKNGRSRGDGAVIAASAKFQEDQDLLYRKHEKKR